MSCVQCFVSTKVLICCKLCHNWLKDYFIEVHVHKGSYTQISAFVLEYFNLIFPKVCKKLV